MIHPDKVPLREFDEAACLKYIADSEKVIDQQLYASWAFGEYTRVVSIPAPADLRFFIRLKQYYEVHKWVVSDLFQNLVSGGYFATFAKPH
jgi:hypothetical protein